MKHLQIDPDDTNARLKLGDLHLKRGDQVAAIEAYGQVAEQFSKSGFDAKAVAIYKQILKIDGGCLEARIHLGDHFQRMGLASDALREFQEAVATCQERGLKREAFDLLKRVATLDPANVPNRLRLAELLLREQLGDEALEEFSSLLEEVEARGDSEGVTRVAERLSEAFPDQERGPIALIDAKLKLGDKAGALAAGTEAVQRLPDSVPLREALVRVHRARGDDDAVQSAFREIAELYKRRGDHDKARDILQRHVPVVGFGDVEEEDVDSAPSLLLSEEAEVAIEGPPSSGTLDLGSFAEQHADEVILQPDPAPAELTPEPPPPPPPARAPSARDSETQVEELLAEARVSLEFEDSEGAAALAQRVLELEPGSAAALDLLDSVAQAQALDASASTGLESDVDLGESLPDIELVLEDEEDSDDEFASIEPPTHVDLAPVEPPPAAPAPAQVEKRPKPKPRPAKKRPAAKPKPEVKREPKKPPAKKAPPKVEEPPDLDEDFEIEFDSDETEDQEAEAPVAAGQSSSQGTTSWASQSTYVQENLEQAERFYEEGRFDEAEQAYREVLDRVPHHPQALVRLGELAEQRGADPQLVSDDEDVVPADPEQSQHDARELLGIDELELSGSEDVSVGTEPGLEESATGVGIDLGAELQAELADDTTEGEESLIEVEPEPAEDEGEVLDAAALLEEAEAEASASLEPEDSFDLAKALDEEDARRSATEQSGVGFEEVFKAFKKGIQEQIGAEEAEAHYDLAIAYKEMGLLEDAVEQLEPVRRSEEHRIDGLSLLATCKLELGRPQEAAGHLAEALAAVDEGDESIVALRYELGRALLEAGKKNQALDAFQKVAALDATFRDVQDRIEELGSG